MKALSCNRCGYYPVNPSEPSYRKSGEGYIRTTVYRCPKCSETKQYHERVSEVGGERIDRGSKDLDKP